MHGHMNVKFENDIIELLSSGITFVPIFKNFFRSFDTWNGDTYTDSMMTAEFNFYFILWCNVA